MTTPENLLAEIGLTTADVYDLHFSGAQELPLILAFLDWFRRRLTPKAKTLDIGCGTGRLLRPLTAAGWEISGVEPREDYRKKAARYAPVYDGDFHRFPAEHEWDFLFAINGPLSYLTRWQEREGALQSCFAALKPGGWLLLDLPNFLYVLKNYKDPTWQVATHGPYEIRRRAVHRFDYGEALWHHEERVEWCTQNAESYKGYTESYTFAIMTPQEIDMMLQKAGFTTIEFYSDWSARMPSRTGSKRILVAAQKG
jgi:SAM-dependent methyltransferase